MSENNDPPAEPPVEREKSPPETQFPVQAGEMADALASALVRKMREEGGETSLSIIRMFSGPLPPPADFERYNHVAPDAADRILKMAEKEQQIRESGQKGAIDNDAKRINGAVLMGVSLIVVAGLATWLENASIALPLGLVGMITVFTRQLLSAFRRPPKED